MKINKYMLAFVAMLAGFLATTANAVPLLCQDELKNHMLVNNAQVSACVDAGVGNINQNAMTDAFLQGGGTAAGYVGAGIGVSYTDNGKDSDKNSSGTWSVASSVDAIGFKFGTGNQPDEWFIFDLVAGVTSGSWDFINVFKKGGGLSHMETYNKTNTNVSAPVTLGLLSMGLFGVSLASAFKRRRN